MEYKKHFERCKLRSCLTGVHEFRRITDREFRLKIGIKKVFFGDAAPKKHPQKHAKMPINQHVVVGRA